MSKGSPLRFGVLGAGWFASRRHIPDICKHPEASLIALCRRDTAALKILDQNFRPERTYTDWREMLADCPLDAVVIASPHNLHFEQATAALEKGVHVIVEKPMTIRSEEAKTLCSAASDHSLQLSVALNPPFWAHCHRIRDAIVGGMIGELEGMSFFWSGDARPLFGRAPVPDDLPGVVPPSLFRSDTAANGGGYLIDGGSHLVSEVLWTAGLRAVTVTCKMDSTPSDIRSAIILTLSNGALATIVSLGDSDHSGRRVRNTIAGSKGTITIEGFEFLTTIRTEGISEEFAEKDLPSVSGPVANLIDAIQGRAHIASPGEHGAHVVEVIEACYRSAETGRTIDLN